MSDGQRGISRREALRGAGALGLFAALPARLLADLVELVASDDARGHFLNPVELRTLRALCAHFVPGPPLDPDPGAREAHVAEYIDLLLGAFEIGHPPIFAGGPFSQRDEPGAENDFARFLGLDALEERVWRTRIEGSLGRPEREWNGPVVGWQQRYRTGLASLEAASRRWGGEDFVSLSDWRKRWLIRMADDELEAFLQLAWEHTLEGMYGAPEYGGNAGLVGWRMTRWPGDHQPHTYTWDQVARVDPEEAEAERRALGNAERYLGRKLERNG
ncbi:gluconate 2-dehydrogenase subunit 3 family protein [Myxococcota bacterium]|nr:gluconate 2-dehydrogenase subunit 3 family protein [Myxococcota bacterium]